MIRDESSTFGREFFTGLTQIKTAGTTIILKPEGRRRKD